MPIYEYECLFCKNTFEITQKFDDPLLQKCPFCDGKVKKLISNTSFVLKGSGWYLTDYASAERKKGLETEKATSEKKSTDTKTEVKSETSKESVAAK